MEQFAARLRSSQPEREIWEYELRRGKKIRRISIDTNAPPIIVSCEACKAEGPFGPNGPITDAVPEGFPTDPVYRAVGMPSDATGICPSCKHKTMHVSAVWMA